MPGLMAALPVSSVNYCKPSLRLRLAGSAAWPGHRGGAFGRCLAKQWRRRRQDAFALAPARPGARCGPAHQAQTGKRDRLPFSRRRSDHRTNLPPLRWPGSWHRKAEPRPCEIVTEASSFDHEIDLDEVLAKLEPLAPPPVARDAARRCCRNRVPDIGCGPSSGQHQFLPPGDRAVQATGSKLLGHHI